MKLTILSFILLSSLSSFAVDSVSLSSLCPAVTSEANNMINSIQNLKGQLKALPECQPIQEKLSLVGTIMSGKKWKDVAAVLSSQGDINLEAEELKEISGLTAQATQALTDVITQISNNNNCVDDKNQASFASKLSGVLKEVSSVVGSVAGPYGIAVSLGGNLVSAAIDGIDKFYKSQHPYNFNKPEEELLFMNQFCAFADIQKDLTDFLTLKNRPKELESLKYYLGIKLKDLKDNCPECDAYTMSSKAYDASQKIINSIKADAQIVDVDNNSNITRCNEINRAIYSTNSDLDRLFKLLEGYKNPLMCDSDADVIKSIVASKDALREHFPNLTTCWKLPLEEKRTISIEFNNFLASDIIPLGNSLFGGQMNYIKDTANKKYKNPLGDYTERTIGRIAWINAEFDRVEAKLKDPQLAISYRELIKFNQDLKDRILKLMEDYMGFMKRKNLRQMKHFQDRYESFSKKSLSQYSKLLGKKITSVAELLKELETTTVVDKRLFYADLKNVQTDLDLSLAQTKTIDRYCDFMNYMLLTNKKTANTCSIAKNELIEMYDDAAKTDSVLKKYVGENLSWLEANSNNYLSSRVQDYSLLLQEWLARGDERWELKPIR